jgi:molybdopterin molybdotransferase
LNFELRPVLELEEAVARILAEVPKPIIERIPLAEAAGRVLGESLASPMDLPPFDNSAMDGYAVRASDVRSASQESPVRLRLAGKVSAGSVFPDEMQGGTCVRIFTGSVLPRGADAVVMQEATKPDQQNPDGVLFLDAVRPWENVRFRGEDVKLGAALAKAGDIVSVGHISLLAAVGLTDAAVAKAPMVALLATGSELQEPGQPLGPGRIFESNRAGLAASVRQTGARPRCCPLVADSPAATRAALEQAFENGDAVITSGGVSVGEMDFVKSAFEQLGGQLQFWKVAIRPGRPFVFGKLGAKLLFGLPGNPVSALVTFLWLVRPALLRWQGAARLELPSHPGVLSEPLTNDGERRHFMRVNVDAAGRVASAGTQASHILSSLAAANGFVDVPPETTLPADSTVQVFRWD